MHGVPGQLSQLDGRQPNMDQELVTLIESSVGVKRNYTWHDVYIALEDLKEVLLDEPRDAY